MNEEIKEKCKNCKYHFIEEISFDYPQSCCNKTNPCHTTEEWLKCDDFEYSKDYITNLQQKYEIAQKDIESLKNNYNDLIKMSENKIDNLQQEVEELREYKKNATRKHWQQKCMEHHVQEKIYKSRCEKAIEYIHKMWLAKLTPDTVSKTKGDLLNILQGSDKQ